MASTMNAGEETVESRNVCDSLIGNEDPQRIMDNESLRDSIADYNEPERQSVHVHESFVLEDERIDSHNGSRVFNSSTPSRCGIRVTELVASLSACLGSLSFGYVLAYSSPATPVLKEAPYNMNIDQVSWYGSITTLGAMAGSLLAGLLLGRLGRKVATMMCGVPTCVGWLLILLARPGSQHLLPLLYSGRFLTGVGAGMASVCAPVYISEVASAETRGMLGSCVQLLITFGIMLVNLLSLGLSLAWLALVGQVIGALSVVLMAFMPETPRWLIGKGRHKAARKALKWLRGSESNTDEEYADMKEMTTDQGSAVSWLTVIKQRQVIVPLLIMFVIFVCQQFSGINAVVFYTQQIFTDAGYRGNPVYPSIAVTAAMVVTTVLSCFLMDRAGRRVLLMLASVLMMLSTVVFGVYYYLRQHHQQQHDWLAVVCLVAYVVFFSLGWGPVPWLVMGEIFPTHVKGMAGGVATVVLWLFTFLLTYSFSYMVEAMQSYGTFWFFGAVCAISFIFVALFLPETKGKTLEEITENFR